MGRNHSLLGTGLLTFAFACSGGTEPGTTIGGGTSGNGDAGTSAGGSSGVGGSPMTGGNGGYFDFGDAGSCPPVTCAGLGWACGYTVDLCGNVVDCADEGLACGNGGVCVGGIDGPTQCQAGGEEACELCSAVPDCDDVAQPTRLTGRVITPGRDDGNTANQVGVPNALVYILRTADLDALPVISFGVPEDGQSCDRCEDQDLGPLLVGAITDSTGNFVLEGRVPVGVDFLLVVKAGKFRRVITYNVPADKACDTLSLPVTMSIEGGEVDGQGVDDNPTRLPRSLTDGLAVNIPKIGISTGRIDAMECVFEKMGIAEGEFGNPGSDASIQMYRGNGPNDTPEGAKIDDLTPNDSELYGSLTRLATYDMIVSDCEGGGWDGRDTENLFPERIANGDKIREYVDRGGRLFASHLSMSWLNENGTAAYEAEDPIAAGLAGAATWDIDYLRTGNLDDSGTGVVSIEGDRPLASPRIEGFATWLVNEGVTTVDDEGVDDDYRFTITDPRSLATEIKPGTEEFIYREGGTFPRVQQFSFNTPFGAPDDAACGRVAYSGFHVAGTSGSSNPFSTSVFPAHCQGEAANDGNLTNQEKVLLYMLFDLGACVGDEPLPPPCVPITCTGFVQRCGYTPDGCGNVLDCGPCRPPA
jgi:hypothetical protein